MKNFFATVATLLFAAACASQISRGEQVTLPLHQPSGVIVSGPRTGTLTMSGGCLYIGDTGERTLPVWPPGTQLVGGHLDVPTTSGTQRRFQIGDRVSFLGSPVPASLLDTNAQRLVERCRGELFSIEYLED